MNQKITILILLIVATFTATAQHRTSVSTRLIPDTIMIGDRFRMEVDIDKDVAEEMKIPQFEKNQISKELEIIGTPVLDTLSRDARSIKLRLSYTMTSFEPGVHRLGGFPIVISTASSSDTIEAADVMQIVVQTFDIDTTKMEIADIKKPMEAPLQWAEIKDIVFYGSVAALILAVIIYFIIRFLKNRHKKTKARPNEPPHITAIRLLEQLHSEKLWQSGLYKEYYSRITDILRDYIECRYSIYAMEMTTDEILVAIKEINSPNLQAKLGDLFRLADLVKFAKWIPDAQQNEEIFQTAYYYVEETKLIVQEKPVENA